MLVTALTWVKSVSEWLFINVQLQLQYNYFTNKVGIVLLQNKFVIDQGESWCSAFTDCNVCAPCSVFV